MKCAICEVEFQGKRSDTKYCSEKCRNRAETIARAENKRKNRVISVKTCKVCSSEFLPHVRNPHQIYCCKKCAIKESGRMAVESGKKKEQYYKYKEKYKEQKRLTDMTYKDNIRFSGNRTKVLERDNYECKMCSAKSQLIIHHKDCSGQSDTINNNMDNLVTLCRKCHINLHKIIN